MLELQSTIRRLGFFAYIAMVPAIPLGILWGTPGFTLGLLIALLWLTYIRATTYFRLWKHLGLRRILGAENALLFRLVKEHCRRLELREPVLAVMPSRNTNLGTFGFSEGHSVLFVSSSLLETFSREELSASLALSLSHLWHRQVPCETWLSGFLLTLGIRETSHFWSFARRILILPLGFIPLHLLSNLSDRRRLMEKTARLTGLPWELNQAVRKMTISIQKEPLHVPLGIAHLFIVSPPARDPISRVLFPRHLNLVVNSV